jgi:CRISPR system Cascade subunit CasE
MTGPDLLPDLLAPIRTIDPATSELYLSRLELNRRNRLVHQEIADSQAFHRRLLDAFPRVSDEASHAARSAHGILYRLESISGDAGAVVALVQSVSIPDWSVLPPDYLHQHEGDAWDAWDMRDARGREPVPVKPTGERYRAIGGGDVLRFRLRSNPTKKIHTTAENHTPGKKPTGPNGTRKPLRQEELPEWIARKGIQHGFSVLEIRDQPDPVSGKEQIGRKPSESPGHRQMTHAAVLFEGVLEVTDAGLFRVALWQGIGPAKAYGFGLLSIAPIAPRR